MTAPRLNEAVPSASRIAVLFDVATREQQLAQRVAKTLGITVLPQELRDPPYDCDGALRSATNEKAEAVLILSSGAFFQDRFRILNAMQRYRLPLVATTPFANAGPSLCYGANFSDMFARATNYVTIPQLLLRADEVIQ